MAWLIDYCHVRKHAHRFRNSNFWLETCFFCGEYFCALYLIIMLNFHSDLILFRPNFQFVSNEKYIGTQPYKSVSADITFMSIEYECALMTDSNALKPLQSHISCKVVLKHSDEP